MCNQKIEILRNILDRRRVEIHFSGLKSKLKSLKDKEVYAFA